MEGVTGMETCDVLNKAADYIEEVGWSKGPNSWKAKDGGGVCIEGALWSAVGHSNSMVDLWKHPAYQAVVEHLGGPPNPRPQFLLAPSVSLWFWNDYKAESQEQVVGVLRAAALIEQAKQPAQETVNA
jgi:hypothetical protein